MKSLLKRLVPDTHPLRLLYHRWRGRLEERAAGNPAKELRVIAVTGTDGKTTTVAMIAHILLAAGKKVGAVSTAFIDVNGVREANPTQKTTLSARQFQATLKRFVDAGCEFAVVEASSHGLLQGRLGSLRPDVAAITNVSMEHLDYHGTMEEYIRAKGLLFHMLAGRGTKVLNADDQSFQSYFSIPSEKTSVYSPVSDLSEIRTSASQCSAQYKRDDASVPIALNIPGAFNLSNALCSLACAQAVGIPTQQSISALLSFRGTPGRLESIDAGQAFHVFIDFTVTPGAYTHTLSTLRSTLGKENRLLVLTGSCGDRMREKRPIVGKICGELSDIVAVTNEDPYTEDPEKIIDEVFNGIPDAMPRFRSLEEFRSVKDVPSKFAVRMSDRLEAIKFLLRLARPGDIVFLAGKGADVTMMTKNGQIPWVERDIAIAELKKPQSGQNAAVSDQK